MREGRLLKPFFSSLFSDLFCLCIVSFLSSFSLSVSLCLFPFLSSPLVHGSAVTAFADDLVKFGTATSATEPEIGQ